MCASTTAAIRYYTQAETRARAVRSSTIEPTFDDLLRLVKQGDVRACEAVDRMAEFLGAGIAILVTGLAPEVIVLVGEITRIWDRVGPIITGVVKKRLPTHTGTRIVPTDPETQPRLLGAITLVLQKYFGAPHVA